MHLPSFIFLKNIEDMLKTTTAHLLAKNYLHSLTFTLPEALPKIMLCFGLDIRFRLEVWDLM